MAKSFLNGLFSLILGQAEDKARSVSEEYLTTGRQGRSTTLKDSALSRDYLRETPVRQDWQDRTTCQTVPGN